MKRFRITLLTALSISIYLVPHVDYAAAFQLYELGTPIIGTAGVGQAVITTDASTAYFNPAGMSALSSTQGMLGSQMALPYLSFSPNKNNTIIGSNGSNAGSFAPGLDAFYVYKFRPGLSMGVSLTSPFGGMVNYNNHWVGRYNVQQMTYYTLNLNPAVSYQLTNWLAFGVGVSVEYANLSQTVALPLIPSILDGQAHLKVSNTAPGYNIGVLVTPTPATKIGASFRSQIIHHLTGNVDFLNISATPAARTKLVNPANVIVSLSQMLTNQFTLLAEAGWANWSSMVNSIVTVDGFTAVTPQNWHDTYRVGLGGQYKLPCALLFQAGASYDSSPTSASRRLPELPMDRQIRIGAGVQYPVVKAVILGLSYEYLNLGRAKIHNNSANGVLSGSYSRNYSNVVQLSLNVSC